MSLAASIRKVLVPINREGYPFLGIAGVATLIALGWIKVLFWPLLILTAWVAYFFRDPQRVTPVREGLVVSPADGVVSQIANVLPPPELGLAGQSLLRVSVFMNVFDCHVNRSPVTGTITKIAYKPGKFLNADLDKASDENERQHLVVEDRDGLRIGFTQIAGLVARRIVAFVKPGDMVVAGQRIGLIRFGSRVDIFLPEEYGAQVVLGQRTIAGETIIARRNVASATGVAQ